MLSISVENRPKASLLITVLTRWIHTTRISLAKKMSSSVLDTIYLTMLFKDTMLAFLPMDKQVCNDTSTAIFLLCKESYLITSRSKLCFCARTGKTSFSFRFFKKSTFLALNLLIYQKGLGYSGSRV